jgi:hypothetical protein
MCKSSDKGMCHGQIAPSLSIQVFSAPKCGWMEDKTGHDTNPCLAACEKSDFSADCMVQQTKNCNLSFDC